MSHKCPSCGSSQTASITVAQARETQTGKFGGLGLSASGDAGIFGGVTTSTSAFGESLSGPDNIYDRRSTSGPLFLALAGGVVAMFAGLNFAYAKRGEAYNAGFLTAVCTLAFIAGVVWYFVNLRFNSASLKAMSKINAKRHLDHARSWVCYQCGAKFQPKADVSQG